MAAATGDMRRALEACTAALELKVQEAVGEQADLAANALAESKSASHTCFLLLFSCCCRCAGCHACHISAAALIAMLLMLLVCIYLS